MSSLFKLSLLVFWLAALAAASTSLYQAKKLSAAQWTGLVIMSGMLGVTWFLWDYESAIATPNLFWRHFAKSIMAGFGSSVIVSYGLRQLKGKIADMAKSMEDKDS